MYLENKIDALTHCILGNFHAFLSSTDVSTFCFEKILSGIPPECQTVWTLTRPEESARQIVWPDLGPNCLPRLSVDNTYSCAVSAAPHRNHTPSLRRQHGDCTVAVLSPCRFGHWCTKHVLLLISGTLTM